MECKVRYFLSQLALKYILSLFIICSHAIFSRVREDAKGKETEVTNKGDCCECLTILRNSAGINRLKGLRNKPLMPQEFLMF